MRCPICACAEVVESRTKGVGKHLLPYFPVARYRCLNCWYRFWAFRNLLIKIVYLFVFSVFLIGGGIKLYSNLMGPPTVETGPADAADPAHKITAAAESAVAGVAKTQPPEQIAPSKKADGGGRPPAPESSPSTEGEGVALLMRPDPESAIAAMLDQEQSYRVIHHDSGWVVLELPGGVVGWARLDDLAALSPAEGEIGRMEREESSRVAFPVETAAAPTELDKTAARSPIETAAAPIEPDKTPARRPIETASAPTAPEKAAARSPAETTAPSIAPEKAAAGSPVETAAVSPVLAEKAASGGAGKNAPVSEKDTAVSESSRTPDTMVVGVDIGRVRKAPSQDAPIVFRILEKEVVQVLEKQADWMKIRHHSGWSGWAHRSLFAVEEPEAVVASLEKTGGGPGLPEGAVDRPGAEQMPAAAGKIEPLAEPAQKPASEPAPPAPVAAEAAPSPERELPVTVQRGRVRSAPSLAAPVLFQIEKGQRFSIMESKEDWFQLRVGSGPGGWAHASLFGASTLSKKIGQQPLVEDEPTTSPADPGAVGGKKPVRIVEVLVGLVRLAPAATAPVKFRLYGNEAVDALETRGEWIRIRRINGWIGWAHESLFAPKGTAGGRFRLGEGAADIATVSVDVGLVREAPSQEAARVCRVVNKMKVEVLAREKDWLKIRMINGWTGWAHRSLFALQETGEGR